MEPHPRRRDTEEVEYPPHAQFTEVVGVAGVPVQPGREERPRDLLLRRDPAFLVLLEAPHLLVGHGLAGEQHEEHGSGRVVQPPERGRDPQAGLVDGRGEEPDQQHLPEADEGEVHHLHGQRSRPLPDGGPAIVLAARLVSSLAREIESQTRAPEDDERRHEVHARGGEVRPGGDDEAVNPGTDRPQAVDPRVLARDGPEQPDHRRQDQAQIERRPEGRPPQRVSDEIDLEHALPQVAVSLLTSVCNQSPTSRTSSRSSSCRSYASAPGAWSARPVMPAR